MYSDYSINICAFESQGALLIDLKFKRSIKNILKKRERKKIR